MFPPLCFVDEKNGEISDDSMDYLEENLSSEDLNVVSENTDEYVFKFKIVELFNEKFSKKWFLKFIFCY